MTHSDTLPAMERRSRSPGNPCFIDHHIASPDVVTRALAPLAVILDSSW